MSAEGYEIRRVGQYDVAIMPAEIDATNADAIRQALLCAVSTDAVGLIIDMNRTTFCDSAGVHAILLAHRQLAATGVRVRLVAPDMLRILKYIGVDKLIPVYPDLEAALTGQGNPTAQPS